MSTIAPANQAPIDSSRPVREPCTDPACGCGKRSLPANARAGSSQREQRTLKITVLRFNPHEPGSRPHLQTFALEEADGMTLYMALNEIRETQDPSLQFDFVCRAGICGSCAMLVNGRPALACRELTQKLDTVITLAPLPVFELIGDLSVNTGKWMRGMSERLQTWVLSLIHI